MRLLVTADLHYNHPRSRPVADDLIGRMNAAGGDAVLLIGDTAVADGDALEHCLARFTCPGPKLFVAGNHELWTHGPDSHAIFTTALPARVRAAGWHWLETDPFTAGTGPDAVAVVGTVGWYDHSYADPALGIPPAHYAAGLTPAAAARLGPAYAHLPPPPADATDLIARWNDARFVHLGRPDAQFLSERIDGLTRSLAAVAGCRSVLAAVHCVPFRQLLPPPPAHPAARFARAYLGSDRLGTALLAAPNVRHVYCGHSHAPAAATIGPAHAVNVGSGYRAKTFHTVDL